MLTEKMKEIMKKTITAFLSALQTKDSKMLTEKKKEFMKNAIIDFLTVLQLKDKVDILERLGKILENIDIEYDKTCDDSNSFLVKSFYYLYGVLVFSLMPFFNFNKIYSNLIPHLIILAICVSGVVWTGPRAGKHFRAYSLLQRENKKLAELRDDVFQEMKKYSVGIYQKNDQNKSKIE